MVFSVSVRQERREKTREDEREEMKIFYNVSNKNKKRQTNCYTMIRKKKPSDESFVRKFRIFPVFSIVYMIRIRFSGPRELIWKEFRRVR